MHHFLSLNLFHFLTVSVFVIIVLQCIVAFLGCNAIFYSADYTNVAVSMSVSIYSNLIFFPVFYVLCSGFYKFAEFMWMPTQRAKQKARMIYRCTWGLLILLFLAWSLLVLVYGMQLDLACQNAAVATTTTTTDPTLTDPMATPDPNATPDPHATPEPSVTVDATAEACGSTTWILSTLLSMLIDCVFFQPVMMVAKMLFWTYVFLICDMCHVLECI